MYFLFFVISLAASVAGAICGIGGGVIIKPVLDALHLADVSTISFLSGCTVLSMSGYSVFKGFAARDTAIDKKTATPLALGAAVGGVAGKYIFDAACGHFADKNTVGAIQAICLLVITAATLAYTLKKDVIQSRAMQGTAICTVIGLGLGVLSSFLGIGGGPINLMVLGYFFSMKTKTAVQNSLYIILFSQVASLIFTLLGGTVPAFSWPSLLLMIAGGILGGIIGRLINRRMDERMVDRLFICLMAVIILICVYNAWRFLA